MRKLNFLGSLLVSGVLVLTSAKISFAWGKTWMGFNLERAVASAPWKFGPLRIDPVLNLSDVGYDTNLYYGYAGEPVKDYTLTAGPGFTVYLPLKKKIIFQVYDSPQYVYFRKTKSERTWNNYLNAHVHFALNRFFITLGGGLISAKQRWSTEIDIRPRKKERSWDGTLLWQATKKTSFLVLGSVTTYDFENLNFETFNIRDRLNRRELRLSFRGYYQLSYRIRFFLDAQYGTYDFLQKVSSSRDSRSYGLFGGLEFSPLGIIRGLIHIGYKTLEPLDKTQNGYKGLAGDSQLIIRPLKFLAIRGAYRRDIQFSIWYNTIYYLESRVGGGASLYIFRRIRLDYDYWDGRNRYPVTQSALPSANIKRSDDYITHSLGLYFRLKKNIGVGVVASLWKRESNLASENDNRDFVGLNLTYDF